LLALGADGLDFQGIGGWHFLAGFVLHMLS
jgi:hypothetical protein